MTRYSQNGYPACVESLLAHFQTPGVPISYVMRRGATSTVLLYFVQRWDTEIEPVTSGGCYACRDIIGSSTTSNHASGTAVDINPGKHPLASMPSLALRTRAHRILDTVIGGIRVGDVLRWGGDYHSRKDSMHIEINAPLALVTRLAQAILAIHPPVPVPTGDDDMPGIVKRNDESEQYVTDSQTRRWIVDQLHLDGIKALWPGIRTYDHFSTDAGMDAVAGPLAGKDSPRKEALRKAARAAAQAARAGAE